MRRSAAATLLSLALFAAGPRAHAEDPPASDAWGEGAMLTRRFETDRAELRRAFDLPLSGAWLDRDDRFLSEWEKRLAYPAASERLLDSGHIRPVGPDFVDVALLREHVRNAREELVFARKRRDESLRLLPFAPDLLALEEARRRLENPAPRDAASRLDAARKAVADVRGRIEKGLGKKPEEVPQDAVATTPVAAFRAARRLDDLRGALAAWFKERDGYEPEFAWWCRKPWEALHAALEEHAKFLREKVAGATGDDGGPLIGDPIGLEGLVAAFKHEFIPYAPQDVLAIADREMAWCEAEAKKAAQEMGFGEDWKKALAKVKEDNAPPGRQDAVVAEQAREAIEFVTSRDLVTVPELCREVWRLQMIPEGTQRTMPYAYYSGQAMGVAYPTDAMEHDRKLQSMRGNNVHFSRIVTPHELIPGHHLQLFVAERNRSYRDPFGTPFLVEGWALYWEMRLWDLGWAKSPENRMGMLFWRMHRCARITVSLKFHLGEMTPAQMVDYLVDRVGHERDGATAEVRRYVSGSYGPLYQAAYMLGGLQLRALHKELVASGKMSERDFHDAVLRENSIPVRMIRASLTNEELGPGGPAPWRFAD